MNKYFKLCIFSIILLLVSFSPVASANSDPTNYPYKSEAKGDVDEWNFYTRYCTSYSAYRADQILGNFYNQMPGPNNKSDGKFGHAYNWNNNADYIGFSTGKSPAPGSIAVWEPGDGDSGSVGHVAYVEKVIDSGKFEVSEYNWNGGDGNYNYRTITIADDNDPSFIYLSGSACLPPQTGDWIISSDCNLSGNLTVPASIIIQNNSNVSLSAASSIDINFNISKILVKAGSKLFISPSAKIY